MSQPDFLYELFEDFMDDPTNQDFSMDNGLVCRWMTGQAKISPKISAYYSKPSNQENLAHTIHQNLLPLMSDCNMAIQDIYTLFIQDDSISDAKKKNLTPLYKPASSRLLFLAKLISFGMERQFIKRNTKNQKLLGGLYRMNGHPDLAREHMEKSISLLDQFNLLHINDSIPQIANYAMFLTEQQEPERGISELQKLSGIIKEYHSNDCLDYAKVQETLGTIYLMTANLPQAKTHFKKAFKIYEKIWADKPEMIEAKYQEIQELYPQIGFSIGKTLSVLLTKQS
ncbi:tetratricopeptide repeat protein [[Ruminococcus] gnavus]|uniref:Tetratricopeptide repeat protein n=2 Tax=Bacillota TaxID=1239 RepID=A0AAJ1AWX7_MEDGN|nr:tetratricopeptide repeat protein [Mediterraneibacter gnavus]MCC3678411.1 tetratricopeptide repeat protein [[Clostridium] nexile]MCB5494055.1 tetratricopeptide repeat protein [Mediterraneibacter gnavus]MCB5593390.1 tetratricopeptide repeat protein [Mediterraneibacter gnavus]MCB5606083.1 tetratricopeptide repeat protein [Mediterraneibacter gnavus]MCG4523165.1 tetratricopeptide repeat protein [Mediterraneibacter gnavus]